MYVKAVRKGHYDLAKSGMPVDIKVGQVFEVPDNLKVKDGSWIVRCDKQGNITDPNVARQEAEKARAKANKEAGEAKLAADKAAKESKEADAAEKRAKELEAAALPK